MSENPVFETFKEQFPDVYKAFDHLFKSTSSQALDEKTKQLIYLGILTATRYAPAIKPHVQKALAAGATETELKEAMLLAIPASGICGFLTALPEMIGEIELNRKCMK